MLQEIKRTGGGEIGKVERRVANSLLYADVAGRLGVSATGLTPRLDSDAQKPTHPTSERLKLSMEVDEQDEEDELQLTTPKSVPRSSSKTSNEWNVTNSAEHVNDYDEVPISHSKATTSHSSSNENVYHDTFVRRKKYRDLNVERQLNLFEQNLSSQKENNKLQSQYLKLQIQLAQKKMEKVSAEIDLLSIEAKKQTELARLEVKKQSTLAQMECQAKYRDLGFVRSTNEQQPNIQQRQQHSQQQRQQEQRPLQK